MENEFFIKDVNFNASKPFKCVGRAGDFLFWIPNYNLNTSTKKLTLFKTDINFNLVWGKEILGEGFFFNLTSSLSGNDEVIFLASLREADDSSLKLLIVKMDVAGNVLWRRKHTDIIVNNITQDNTVIKKLSNDRYVINADTVVFTIDENGNLITSKQIRSNTSSFFSVRDIEVYNNQVYLYNSIFLPGFIAGILVLDNSLNIVSGYKYRTVEPNNAGLGTPFITRIGNKLALSGTVSDAKRILTTLDLNNSLEVDKCIHVENVGDSGSSTTNEIFEAFGELYLYYSSPFDTGDDTLIYKFSSSLSLRWVKRLKSLPIWTPRFKAFNKFLIFTTHMTGRNWDRDSIIKTNIELISKCIDVETETGITQDLSLTKENHTFFVDNFSLTTTTPNYQLNDLGLFDITLICQDIPFDPEGGTITQSSNLYLQAAGSTGSDGSTSGIHLRWLLKKDLINHLPKGNLASGTVNYNKPNDFVIVYRAPYTTTITSIDFSQPPKAVENRNALWIYQSDGKAFYLYFRNKIKYATVRGTYDPLTQATQFIQNYGTEILELQTASDLFFALGFTSSSTASSAKVETEILSVEGTGTSEKRITARKTFMGTALSNARMVTENGKGFRFRPTNCQVTAVDIELYSVLSDTIENGTGWTELGQFALSETDTEVFDRLEPTAGTVDATWPRYNDDALVKIQNYKDKWNQQNPSTLSSIKQTVQDYIALSDAEDNPTALETFAFEDVLPDGATTEENTFQLSNLLLLQQASMDFHVARMLGLGHLDIDTEIQNSDAFVYMAVYRTAVSLVDGQLATQNIEHRYITVPTSRNDEKLPVALDLKPPVPGVFLTNGIGENSESLTDADGYTLDGKSRFITLYAEEPQDLSHDNGFYNSNTEFNLALETFPVLGGIEYKKTGEADWRRPELPNTSDYVNAAPQGQTPYNETLALPIPDEGTPLFVHRETESGEHVYSSYGINWFSRINRSTQEYTLTTTIEPANILKPPSDRSALLVIEESPLLLTTANEQQLLSSITGTDKTLVRLMFNFHTEQELLSYKVTERTLNGATDPLDPNAIFPDDQEIFADEIEIYFRDAMPLNATGKATNVSDHPTNEILSVITTGSYTLDSTGLSISPTITTGQMANFVGGVLVLEENEFIIHEVSGNENTPTFTVYKKQVSDKLQNTDAPNPSEELIAPQIKADGMFLAVENLQNTSSWGTPNPHPLKVQIGDNWGIHREVITQLDPDGQVEEYLQKTRGIWDTANIEKVLQAETVSYDQETGETTVLTEIHKGQYKATFSTAMLADHPQSSGANPAQWYRGIVRVHTEGNPNGERRNLEVFKIENMGTGSALIVYFTDIGFSSDASYDEIQTGSTVQVNFYPGYRIYLYADSIAGISEDRILPETGEGIKYSCFGFRSTNITKSYSSRIAVPTVLYAQEVIAPLIPQLPVGALYATRPDNFGKATYTLTTQFDHTPHGILYYRADDDAILNAIYTGNTVATIKQAIAESDPSFLANRWQNLLSFDYDYPTNSFQTDGLFGIYPETVEGYRLPNPDNPALFEASETPGSIDPGNMTDTIKEAILQVFVPLTEVPLLYEYINGGDYEPIPKKQTVRDRNGAVLSPTDPEFDIAPMAKRTTANTVQFTDFTLDGTSNNLYFYSVKELSNTLQMSDSSSILGPIKLIHTNPPKQPAIRQVVPILENPLLGIPPQIEMKINAYPKVENIKKLSLYRALSPNEALSIRTMQLVKEIDLETLDVLNENIWGITDDFEGLAEVPFGDALYYRIAVSREIEYPDKDDDAIIKTEYMPSEASKLVVTAIVENASPISPQISYIGDLNAGSDALENVVLSWDKTAYNATYYVFKMNSSGQWSKIYEVTSNETTISVPLGLTSLGSGILPIVDTSNNDENIFHHFKITVENSSGLLSTETPILTIPTNTN
ncbi:MAG: hypothetical protein WBG90_00115 [Saonia sp.]